MSPELEKKEIATTVRWGIGIIVAIIMQTITVAWYFAQQDATIQQHTSAISKLENSTSFYISREQLDDLLGARDEKTANIERSLNRIESKLDKVIQ